jgi:hypothetical protein
MVTLIRKRFLNKHLITRTAARFVRLTFDGCQILRAVCPPVALKVSSVELLWKGNALLEYLSYLEFSQHIPPTM